MYRKEIILSSLYTRWINMEFLGGSLLKLMSKILRVVYYELPQIYPARVWTKRIAIAKCDLFFHYRDSKEISFYYFRDNKVCAKHKKIREFHRLGDWMVFSSLLPSPILGFYSNNGTRLLHCKMQKVFHLRALQAIFLWFKIFALIRTLYEYDKLKKRIPSQVHFTDFVHRI